MDPVNRTDLAAAVVLVAFAAVGLAWVVPTQTSPPQMALDLPPAFVPNLALGVLLVLGVVLGLRAQWRLRNAKIQDHDIEFGAEASGFGRAELINTSLWFLVSALAMLAMPVLGFAITGGLMIIAAMLFAGQRNPWVVGLVGIIAPVLIDQLSWHALSIELPPLTLFTDP